MNRSFTARLSANTPRRLRDYLWATHRLFNESLAYLLKHYFWMQNLTDRHAETDQRNRLRQRFHADSSSLAGFQTVYEDLFGKHLPKNKRQGRSQNAHAWLEQVTFSAGSRGGDKNKGISEEAKHAIKRIRGASAWLFDRQLAFPLALDNGFRRSVFQSAARRLLNFEQNEETHRGYYEDARKAFDRWTGGQHREDADDEGADTRRGGWRRTVLLRTWSKTQTQEREAEIDEIGRLSWEDFDRMKSEFAAYERTRSEQRAREHAQLFNESRIERINGAMTRGWRDIYELLLPPDGNGLPDKATAERIIKDYQAAEPRKVGDINFFLWLADKPYLWRFVETTRRFNDFQRKLEQYKRPIQFRYPRHNRRPEWFSFSENSPGHMYTIVSMHPMVIDFCVFVPVNDVSLLKKLLKGKPLTDEERSRLNQPVDWSQYRLTGERLAERREIHRTELEKRQPGIIAKSKLNTVHDWTDDVWKQLLCGFFCDDLPLDISKFERMMVRYALGSDSRLAPFVESPETREELTGRLVVESDARQESHWQGRYKFRFGPLANGDGLVAERRRFLRAMPLTIGGIRLEYRDKRHDRLQNDANPIFTLSCDLDESLPSSDGQVKRPAPRHRVTASKLGKPLKRNGWLEPEDGTIVCRFRERANLTAVGTEGGLADEFPLPGIRLVCGKPKPSGKNKSPHPVVVEAIFDRSAGWEHKPEGTDDDPSRYVENWVNQGGAKRIDPGLRALFIDLGMRHIATGAVIEFVDDGKGNGVLAEPLRPLAVEFIDTPGVTLSHIQRHQDERRRKQRKACPRGKRKAFEIRGAHLPRGQEFARNLLEHAENLKDDRCKKAANAILLAALKHGVDYIIFENLKGYRPEMEFGRRYNAALMNWNRRELVNFVKMEATPFGIHVYDYVAPHHTSRFCHRCGAVGHRFTHVTTLDAKKDRLAEQIPLVDKEGNPVRDAKGKPIVRRKWTPDARRVRGTPLGLKVGMRQAIDGGKHFCCTECGLMVNADYNAAMNLARKLADDFPAYQRYSYRSDQKSWVVERQTLVGKAFWERAKALVQRRLNERFSQPRDTAPAGGWPDGYKIATEVKMPW